MKQQIDRLKRACKHTPIKLSSATRTNVTETLRALMSVIDESHEAELVTARAVEWHP